MSRRRDSRSPSSRRRPAGHGEIEAEVLRIWNRPSDVLTAPHPAYYFPILPPSLTGLPKPIVRGLHMPPNADLERRLRGPAPDAAPRRCFLVLAT